MTINNLKLVFFIALTLSVTVCSYHSLIALNPQLKQKSLVRQLPLGIGIYKSPEFINRLEERKASMDRDDPFVPISVFPIGQASSILLDQVLVSMFLNVVPVSSADTRLLSPKQKLAGIIEVNIEGFSCLSCNELITVGESTSITYRINITDTKGKHILTWFVTGQVTREQACQGRPFCALNEIIEFAMLDAMSQFMVDFYDKPEVTRWLSNHAINSGNP